VGGVLTDIPAVELGAIVIRESLRRAEISPEAVDEVFMGCVLQAAKGQNVARQASLKAGLPDAVPAQTINIVCGSGLKSVNIAAAMIQSGEADIIVAGGTENMSSAPFALEKARYGYRMGHGSLVDTMIRDSLWCAIGETHMGITAENVAQQYGITREMQDTFAVSSQNKCEAAQKAGKFREEIVPVTIKAKKETINFTQDEYPRDGVTIESISSLRPAFQKDGTVTAANSSGINDGAAAVVVMSADKAKELGITPMAKWAGGSTAGVDPSVMGIGPATATMKLLEKTGYSIEDINLIESNEAFAAQSLAVGKLLGWNADIVNVNGGAIALGHPVGASGCRILVTLLHELRRRDAKIGLATLCVGGGMGVSVIVEAIG
jgi:acetyl-CoA C-acetyltransferase